MQGMWWKVSPLTLRWFSVDRARGRALEEVDAVGKEGQCR